MPQPPAATTIRQRTRTPHTPACRSRSRSRARPHAGPIAHAPRRLELCTERLRGQFWNALSPIPSIIRYGPDSVVKLGLLNQYSSGRTDHGVGFHLQFGAITKTASAARIGIATYAGLSFFCRYPHGSRLLVFGEYRDSSVASKNGRMLEAKCLVGNLG